MTGAQVGWCMIDAPRRECGGDAEEDAVSEGPSQAIEGGTCIHEICCRAWGNRLRERSAEECERGLLHVRG